MNRNQFIYILCLLTIATFVIISIFDPTVGFIIFFTIFSIILLTSLTLILLWVYQELGSPYHAM